MNHDITVIHHETPVARKAHHCDECGDPIEPGTTYVRQRNTAGGDIWTYKAHGECWESMLAGDEPE